MWHDLTRCIHPGMVVWPGDPSPEVVVASSIDRGESSNTSVLRFPSHLGTHLDAPYHFIADGKRLEEMNLEALIGRARLIDLSDRRHHITRADLEAERLNGVERVLIRTFSGRWLEESEFRPDFIALAPDGAEYLVEKRIRLVGIDYLSIEPFRLAGHPVHRTLLSHEVVVVEGLDLSRAPTGDMEFICLPLKIKGADGSPCRAVARPI